MSSRIRFEAELSDAVAAELRGFGYRRVEREYPLAGGFADVAVLDDELRPVELYEVKVRQPLAGIGQLLGYCYGLPDPRPLLTLVVPRASVQPHTAYACGMAGVMLWPYAATLAHPRDDDPAWRALVRTVQTAQTGKRREDQLR
jgi:hypothetical protein